MGNTFALSLIRLFQRLSIVLTLGCCAYVGLFFFSKDKGNSLPENTTVASPKGVDLIAPVPSLTLNLKNYQETGDMAPVRDIFSLAAPNPSGVSTSTPKGQLPDHLKVVGILIAHPSQIIVEDTSLNTTFFIDEGQTQDGISLAKVSHDQVTVNYQGQDINVPISKS